MNSEITKRFFTCSNILERFRTTTINEDPKLDFLRYFKNSRRKRYAKYLQSETYTQASDKGTEEKEEVLEIIKDLDHHKLGFTHSSQQQKELKGDIYSWHKGELIAFVHERPGGWSEFLISTPLGTQFKGESLWGTGVNFDFLGESRVLIFTEGPSLLCVCDLIIMLIEGLDVRKRKNKSDQEMLINENEETFMSNLIIDFYHFNDNLDNAYAAGYDALEYLTKLSEEGRIFNSYLYLEDQKEDMTEHFKCNFFL